MPLYDATLILRPELSEEERELFLKEVKDVIVDGNGEVKGVNLMGIQRFTYEIEKFKEGFFVTINFHSDSSGVNRIQEFFAREKRIIRTMIIRKKIFSEKKREKELKKLKKKREKEGEGGGQIESSNLNRESHPGS